jgi:hypothetical protein
LWIELNEKNMESLEETNPGNPVPEQVRGSQVNSVAESQFATAEQARAFYQVAKDRLLNVNQWYKIAQLPMSAFKLFDQAGRGAQRPARQGDFIRIDIPGPGPKAGKGYDWVVIELLSEDQPGQLTNMLVRPCAHPLENDEQTAHFLKNSSTNTLQVVLKDKAVRAEQHGRNEEANNDTGIVLDNLRNTMVGWGSKLGFSYPQWKSLVDGLAKRG